MRILVACEHSGVVRDAFAARGHDAVSCDLLPTTAPGCHIVGDVLDHLQDGWDLMIAHPPCQYLASSGLHWNSRVDGRAAKSEAALAFARALLDAPIPKVAIENPIGMLGTRLRPPNQIVQPWQFGHNASKATCLWTRNLPPLVPTDLVPPERYVDGLPRWANQMDTGQCRQPDSRGRWQRRSRTYPGIAAAMAAQWGCDFALVPPPDPNASWRQHATARD